VRGHHDVTLHDGAAQIVAERLTGAAEQLGNQDSFVAMLFSVAVARGDGGARELGELGCGHDQGRLQDAIACGGAFDAKVGCEAG
jgi:hypothetical protein